MNELTKELVRGLMEVDDTKIVALYGGGFKPPIRGHFNVVKQALAEYPEIDEFRIFVGGLERDGIDQTESLLIWDIYKNYLPQKVKIIPAKNPIGDIYRAPKNDPELEFYWVIGKREGEEDDEYDIKTRSAPLITNPDKYPNLNLKTITTTDSNMRARNARKALTLDSDEFKNFLPHELSDEDKEEVYNIASTKLINENITKNQLDSIESYADGLFNKLGIDIDFTKHFFDRLNDIRNKKPISVAELIGIFKKLYKKHGKPLSKTEDDLEAVVKDFNKNINIPFVIDVDQNGIDMTAKTIMRKQDFQTSNPVIPLEENATYSDYIDYKGKIKDLTKHMIKMGLNILPLPKVIFYHSEKSNAKNFFGKTAYYNPETKTIVLYTEGRHPKDIVRSFSHEMIHHIQNLEDRLGDIMTTNTNEDEDLDAIEREAYQEGNMIFRNWTDSIDGKITTDIEEGGSLIPIKVKKTKKDPFGLNAYALELAKGLEETIDLPNHDGKAAPYGSGYKPITEDEKYTIYSDMDGVIADFDTRFKQFSDGIPPSDYVDKFGLEKFWELIDDEVGVRFWTGIEWMPGSQEYWDYIKKYNPILLSAPSRNNESRLGKRMWAKRNLPGVKLILSFGNNKKNYANENSILIDDREKNINQWKEAGGIGILHTSVASTIAQLKELGL